MNGDTLIPPPVTGVIRTCRSHSPDGVRCTLIEGHSELHANPYPRLGTALCHMVWNDEAEGFNGPTDDLPTGLWPMCEDRLLGSRCQLPDHDGGPHYFEDSRGRIIWGGGRVERVRLLGGNGPTPLSLAPDPCICTTYNELLKSVCRLEHGHPGDHEYPPGIPTGNEPVLRIPSCPNCNAPVSGWIDDHVSSGVAGPYWTCSAPS